MRDIERISLKLSNSYEPSSIPVSPQPPYHFAADVYFVAREEPVLAAEELRYAAQAIAKVTGRIDVENVLDVVFREFCIGK